jgi:hypothetical protein
MMDDDNLYFSFDDEPEGGDDTPEAEEGQNRSFLVGIAVLAGVFVLGICAVLIYLFVLRDQSPQVSENELTNAANMTAFAITQTQQVIDLTAGADGVTQEPVQTTAPGETELPGTEETQAPGTEPSATPEGNLTIPPGETEEVTGEPTEVAEVTQAGASATPITPAAPGGTTPTAIQPSNGTARPTVTPTSGIIEVTALGGSTPTQIAGGTTGGATGGTTGGGSGTTGGSSTGSGVGGPFQPTAAATLPTTGFKGGGALAGAGLLALALVAVVVVVRYIRLK